MRIFYLLTAFIQFCVLPLNAALQPIGAEISTQTLLVNETYEEGQILQLDDDSYWLVKKIEKRKKTWGEWWHNVEPVINQFSANFYNNPANWGKEDTITVFHSAVNVFPEYPFILKNESAGEAAFARYISPMEFNIPSYEKALELFNETYQESNQLMRCLIAQEAIFILNEGAAWQGVKTLHQKTRSIKEWIKNVTYKKPDFPFVFSQADWAIGDTIQIFRHKWSPAQIRYTTESAYLESFLLYNKRSGKLQYIRPLDIVGLYDYLLEHSYNLYKEGYDEGYDDGYSDGYNNGRSSSTYSH